MHFLSARLQNPVEPVFSAILFIVLTIVKAHIKQSRKIKLGLSTFANSVQGYNPLVSRLQGKHVSEKYDLPHSHSAAAQIFTAGEQELWVGFNKDDGIEECISRAGLG